MGPWVQGIEEFAGEGIGKKFEAPAAPMITSVPSILSSTQLFKNKPKTKQPSVKY
jgi:hypothetical protein